MRRVTGRIGTHTGSLADLGDPDGIDEIGNGVTVSNRRCAKCGVVKPASCFYRNKWAPTGLHHYCRPCEAKRQKLYTRTRNTLEKSRRISGRYRYERIPRAIRGQPHVEAPPNSYDTDSKETGWNSECNPVPRNRNVAPSASVYQTRRVSARLNNLVEEHDSRTRGRKRVAERCLAATVRRSSLEDELSEKRWKTVDEWFAFCCPENPGVDLVETRGAVRRRYDKSPRLFGLDTPSKIFSNPVHRVKKSELMFPDEKGTCWSESENEGKDCGQAGQAEEQRENSKSQDQEDIGSAGEVVQLDQKVVIEVEVENGGFEACLQPPNEKQQETLLKEEDLVKAGELISVGNEHELDIGLDDLQDVVVDFGDMQDVVLLSDQERKTSRKSAVSWPSASLQFEDVSTAGPSETFEKQ